MARKRTSAQPAEGAAPLEGAAAGGAVCGGCARAEDHCCRGADGGPVFCRCGLGGGERFYRFCHAQACPSYEARKEPLPDGWSPSVPVLPAVPKVVPLFGKDPLRPVKVVPAEHMRFGRYCPPEVDIVSS